ncbi:hypothetical protein SAMN04488057_11153 [Cyclobacterium lianum]|uniref:Uncharacterized protein n=1 Tax=Cyclobacterium lianum TaxID=388280 RepID=A0A1M7PW79_9BACT|nr:hypothetical protein [Cyclobacterium lianum]SHN21855.1 hypothetical protein SAMN04488057_11153 [Cyclobacterium lianum]
METLEKEVMTLEKEQVLGLRFSTIDVLRDDASIKQRYTDLQRSQILGNISRGKVWIYFETADKLAFKTYTTVWAVGDKFISLKRGITIPINAIFKID